MPKKNLKKKQKNQAIKETIKVQDKKPNYIVPTLKPSTKVSTSKTDIQKVSLPSSKTTEKIIEQPLAENKEKLYFMPSTSGKKNKTAENNITSIANVFTLNEIEETPAFATCENSFSQKNRKTCLNNTINTFISSNLNENIIKSSGITEMQRSICSFIISKNGDIVNINIEGGTNIFKQELKNIIKQLPRLTPGRHNNQLVETLYSIPITVNPK